jgi:hypothetical protein
MSEIEMDKTEEHPLIDCYCPNCYASHELQNEIHCLKKEIEEMLILKQVAIEVCHVWFAQYDRTADPIMSDLMKKLSAAIQGDI